MTKQEKIQEAYGEHWEAVKDLADENGFINGYAHVDGVCGFKSTETEENSYGWRPISLRGIENNNGWVAVDNKTNLLQDFSSCFVFTDKNNIYHYSEFIAFSSICEMQNITHYQPIQKPTPPLY